MKQKKKAPKKKSHLYEILSLRKLPWNFNWLKYTLLTVVLVSMAGVPAGYAEGTSDMDNGAPSYDDSANVPGMEFELGIIQDIERDGTLVLTNGKRIKVSESLLRNPALHLQREILIYIKGGIPRVDSEGRITGATVILNSPNGANASADQSVREVTASGNSIAYSMAARSTVTPPLMTAGNGMIPTAIVSANVVADDFFATSEGNVSGSALLSGIAEKGEQG